ncbi:hypothetical protein [Mycobacterium sp. SP-6446]|uniref:hypothetical protein n=1 Tax=Mycobacterium sp. SP-6446 TaxID=1834162 RepID=UPI0011157D7D|nr:hypothetical protein [Mycobacterium sp. SP-6446]
MDQDSWRPPSLPIHDYRSQRTFGGPSHPKPDQRTDKARLISAAWFAQHRRGGHTMLHHRSLAPVIQRDWSPPNVLFESALNATATVSQPDADPDTDRTIGSFDYIRPGPANHLPRHRRRARVVAAPHPTPPESQTATLVAKRTALLHPEPADGDNSEPDEKRLRGRRSRSTPGLNEPIHRGRRFRRPGSAG